MGVTRGEDITIRDRIVAARARDTFYHLRAKRHDSCVRWYFPQRVWHGLRAGWYRLRGKGHGLAAGRHRVVAGRDRFCAGGGVFWARGRALQENRGILRDA